MPQGAVMGTNKLMCFNHFIFAVAKILNIISKYVQFVSKICK